MYGAPLEPTRTHEIRIESPRNRIDRSNDPRQKRDHSSKPQKSYTPPLNNAALPLQPLTSTIRTNETNVPTPATSAPPPAIRRNAVTGPGGHQSHPPLANSPPPIYNPPCRSISRLLSSPLFSRLFACPFNSLLLCSVSFSLA